MNTFMAAAPMVSSYYQRYDTQGTLSSASGVSGRGIPIQIPPELTPKPKPRELHFPVVDPELYIHRRNSSREALGEFRRLRFVCFKFYFSTDVLMGAIPTGITVVLIIVNMALVWHQVGWREYIFTLGVFATTLTSSFLTTSIDPGIYPRLRSGERDPLEGNTQLVFCKECRLRRPPRCAHCYECRVCVLEHDHHCNILGGCVGVRNLRWFTLYLLSCFSSTVIGVVWLTRYFFCGLFTPNVNTEDQTGLQVVPTLHASQQGGRPSFAPAEHPGYQLAALFVLLLDGVLMMLVGAMLCVYIYLTMTSTTRRESMRKQNSPKALLRPRVVLENLKRLLKPPPSLLDSDDHSDEETTNLI
ncbi:palmitoyl acyltransferase 9, putative [Leishmania guyanensis]|uniref:Palmitoyltransferase n=1 Tax=Leishmania guyanensis TaxID=5670 RepID=A0A1E1J9C2_LEIGU|nr:hypothetical protein, conserved [Leishmania guyanensis]